MGIYDRDYYRDDEPPFWARFASGRAALALAGVILALFVAEVLTTPRAARDLPGRLCGALELNPDLVRAGQGWRVVTAPFVARRDALVHVFAAVTVLVLLGTRLEARAGWRRFVLFALGAALFGSLVKLALAFGAGFDADLDTSGAATLLAAVAVAAARLFPKEPVELLVSVPAWAVAALLVGLDVLAAAAERFEHDGHAAHLAGAAFGLACAQFAHTSSRSRAPRRSLRVVPPPAPEPRPRAATPSAPAPRPAESGGYDEQLEAKLDQVLEKVARSGRASLTAEEQAILQRASEAIKRRQTRA